VVNPRRFAWQRKARADLAAAVKKQLLLYDEGTNSGRIVHEIGAAFSVLLLRDQGYWSACSDRFIAPSHDCKDGLGRGLEMERTGNSAE
jgi:hypothetical protein